MKEVSIYRVGLLRDLHSLRTGRFTLRQFAYWFSTSWRRRSYWNGYLCESENKPKAGKGWTRKSAYRSWERIDTDV